MLMPSAGRQLMTPGLENNKKLKKRFNHMINAVYSNKSHNNLFFDMNNNLHYNMNPDSVNLIAKSIGHTKL